MCGIVGAVAQRNIVPVLIEGLRRLEYRGYDSCGVAVLSDSGRRVALVALRAWPIWTSRCMRATSLGDARRAGDR
jgi:asparagine synthetase B (glutamine-hydrolysing)